MVTTNQLRQLAQFLPELESREFKAGEMRGGESDGAGVFTMPYAGYSDTVNALVQHAYYHGWILRDFNWSEWAQTQEARDLFNNAEALAKATPDQLAQLLTLFIRQDRFAEGTLLDAFNSGLILRIVQRAAALSA